MRVPIAFTSPLWILTLALSVLSGCNGPTPSSTDGGVDAATQEAAAAVPTARASASARNAALDEPIALAPPPPRPDTRTAVQIAMAACPPGRCKGSAIKPLLAGPTNQPIIPASYTVPAWTIDPANSLGCASDTNSGTSATCSGGCSGSTCPSGIGPLLTWQELSVHRWGFQGGLCPTPRLQQNTSITFISNDTNADPVSFCPQSELGTNALLLGNLGTGQQVCTGTISAVTSISRGAVATGLTQLTLPCNAAVGDLVFDSTQNAYFWTYKVNGAAPAYFTTTPVTLSTPGAAFTVTSKTLSSGDSVTVYSPVTVNVIEFSPFYVQDTSTVFSYMSNLTVAFSGNQRDPIALRGVGQGAIYTNVSFQP